MAYTVFGGIAHSDEESGITSSSIAWFPVENIKEHNTKLKDWCHYVHITIMKCCLSSYVKSYVCMAVNVLT